MATTPPKALRVSHSSARSKAVTRSPATAAPHGLACLMMATAAWPGPASAASSCTRRQAASPSKMFRYDSGVPLCWVMSSHQLGEPATR